MYLIVLITTVFPFQLLMRACNRTASRLGEAWPRPRLRRKMYWQGQSETHVDSKLYNIIVEVPARLKKLLVTVLPCWAAGARGRPQGKPRTQGLWENCSKNKKLCDGTKFPSSNVRRPWTLEQNTLGQALRQASRQASRALKALKLEQNNMTKNGAFFGAQNEQKKADAQKNGSPQFNSSRSCCW